MGEDSADTLKQEEAVLREELIPDHSRAADERDLFDHDDYVDRLIQVIDHVDVSRTSANIALYGSWGSGKSGIGNALKDFLDARDDIRYAEFEAFKFGRDPLLRNFVSQLSEQLFVDNPSRVRTYRRRLYEATSRPHVDLEQAIEAHPIRWWVGTICVGLLSGLALGFWIWPGSDHQQEAGNYFKLVGFLLFSVFLTYFTLSRSRNPAASDEEFEALFREMLERVEINGESERKLVVFVDELDRCAPSEVAATLESIRTFLGVRGCIFIVAADQQVLEHALTEQLRQSTPPDLANPYYSAGSAYLDKIFQYQLSFPPLRARRLTAFALELVENRKGVWADPGVDKEDVLSILLPTHIHSPRRVKVLLNAFALSYGIASERAKREKLPAIADRASELAKLVCIKFEFPLFARDLALDDRLVSAVLLAARAIDGDGSARQSLDRLPEDLRLRAVEYASGQLRVAQLLSPEESALEIRSPHLPPTPDTPAEIDDGQSEETEVIDLDPNDAWESMEGDIEQGTVQARHATQLVRYLEKTERVEGPGADLIHLESAGARWGLDAQQAEILERDARDNRVGATSQRITELEPDDRLKALLMLGNLARESVGHEADNALGAMLAGAAAAKVPLASIAAELVKDVKAYDDRRGLRDPHLPGALLIAIAANNQQLIESILDHNAVVQDPELRFALLENGRALLPRHRDRLIMVLPRAIRSDTVRAKAALDALDPEVAEDLLRASAGPSANYAQNKSAQAEEVGDPEVASRYKEEADAAASASSELAEMFLTERPVLAELAFLPIFDMPSGGERIFNFLEQAGPLKTPDASSKVLAELDQYELDETAAQLRALDEKVIQDHEEASFGMDRLAAHLWRERENGSTEVPDAIRHEVTRLLSTGLRPAGSAAIERIEPGINRNVASDDEFAEFRADEEFAYTLADLDLIPPAFVADCVVRTIARSLSGPGPEPRPEALSSGFCTSLEWASEDASSEILDGTLEQITEGTWLEDPEQLVIELLLQAALGQHQEIYPPSADELQALLTKGTADDQGVAVWIENFAAAPEEVYAVVESSIGNLSSSVQHALSNYTSELGPKPLAALNLPAITKAFSNRPSHQFFSAARLDQADENLICDALVGLANRADNLERRTLVLDIWQQMKPSKRKVREALIRDVFLPIAEAGATSHDLSRKRLELTKNPPSGVKDELLKRLAASAPDEGRRKKLEKKLEQIGLTESAPGFISRLFRRR